MLDLLLSVPAPVASIVVVVLSVALTLAALAAVRRRFPAEALRAGNEVAGFLYGVLGAIYGIVLAFVLVAVYEDFGQAAQHVEAEVAHLGSLHRDAEVFAAPDRAAVRDALVGYVRSIVDDEWPALAAGTGSPRTAAAYDRVWSTYYAVDPGEGRVAVFYEQSVDRLTDAEESRRGRILASRSGMPPTMWLMLVVGAIVVVGVSFLLGSAHPGTQRLSVAAIAGVVAFALFVTVALDHPFRAGIALSRRPYVDLLEEWTGAV